MNRVLGKHNLLKKLTQEEIESVNSTRVIEETVCNKPARVPAERKGRGDG